MIFKKLFVATLFVLTFCRPALAEYEIKGKVNLSPDWQQQIFLATSIVFNQRRELGIQCLLICWW